MVLKGNDMIVKVGGVALAASKSCELNIKADDQEVSHPNDGSWKRYIAGRRSWSISTNHIVTSLSKAATMVGETVSIEVGLRQNIGLPFNGFVNNVQIYSGGYQYDIDAIYWDKTRKIFVAAVNVQGSTIYYQSWSVGNAAKYMYPSNYEVFSYNGGTQYANAGVFTWYNNELTNEKLTGSALVTSWKSVGTKFNLLQGSFSFKGNGPLTPANLP